MGWLVMESSGGGEKDDLRNCPHGNPEKEVIPPGNTLKEEDTLGTHFQSASLLI